MIDLDNQTDFTPDFGPPEAMMKQLGAETVELVICSDETIRGINREFRGIDKATDVLSFPCEPMPMAPLGSIVISADHVAKGAETYGHDLSDEFALLFLHGLLHLLGYDHETDDGGMRQKEEAVIKAMELPQSLIVRSEGA